MTSALAEQLHRWMDDQEGEHLEFKETKSGIDSGELLKHWTALSSGGVGSLALGARPELAR
jgi:hypothetical protein